MAAVNNGDRVMVKSSKYREVKRGCIGTVMSVYLSNIAVRLDDLTNNGSQYGYYYFNPNQIEKLTYERTKTTMDGNYRIALVKFIEGTNTDKAYEYALYDNDINVNDNVVVKSAHHGLGIGTIVGFAENVGQDVTREIICKADFAAYNARLDARKRRDELRTSMAKRAAQMQEIAVYKVLAEADPDMAAMLKEYMELGNGG